MQTKQRRAKGLSAFVLKFIAILLMLIDHIGVILIPYIYAFPFRIVGRLAFPLFGFFIVEGQQHTRNTKKYVLRILVLALISESIFDRAFYGSFFISE